MLLGQVLALGSQKARTKQKEIHQKREADTENFGAEKRIEMDKKSDADASSKEEDTDDMEFADDESTDGEEGREEQEEEKDEGQDEVEVEQHDKESDEEEGRRDLENGGEGQEASSIAIIIPSQIEITRITIDEETWRTFYAKPTEEKVTHTILAGLAFAVTGCLALIGFALWVKAQAFENVIVTVEWS